MDKRYKVIFSGLAKEGQYFKQQMSRLGVSEDISERIIKNSPAVMKKGLTLKNARIYADAIIQAGGKTVIQEDNNPELNQGKNGSSEVISLKQFTMCPQCGFKQLREEKCVRCGLLFMN